MSSLLTNNDVVISSETGSGKTLTYLLPLFQKIFETKFATDDNGVESTIAEVSVIKPQSTGILNANSSYPHAVILVPNKDLAAQVVTMGKALSEALYNVSGIQINVSIELLKICLVFKVQTSILTFSIYDAGRIHDQKCR